MTYLIELSRVFLNFALRSLLLLLPYTLQQILRHYRCGLRRSGQQMGWKQLYAEIGMNILFFNSFRGE